ncbi:MAG: AAA family ATPase [Thomasclavelia sp.]
MKRICMGIENFKELIDNNNYYVDKTMLIEDVLNDAVMLYSRPRRFTRPCIILECKHSSGIASLIKDSQKAAKQIKEKQYSKDFLKLGYPEVLGYGISFYKKQCIITKA